MECAVAGLACKAESVLARQLLPTPDIYVNKPGWVASSALCENYVTFRVHGENRRRRQRLFYVKVENLLVGGAALRPRKSGYDRFACMPPPWP
jgi:hypothetical protein